MKTLSTVALTILSTLIMTSAFAIESGDGPTNPSKDFVNKANNLKVRCQAIDTYIIENSESRLLKPFSINTNDALERSVLTLDSSVLIDTTKSKYDSRASLEIESDGIINYESDDAYVDDTFVFNGSISRELKDWKSLNDSDYPLSISSNHLREGSFDTLTIYIPSKVLNEKVDYRFNTYAFQTVYDMSTEPSLNGKKAFKNIYVVSCLPMN